MIISLNKRVIQNVSSISSRYSGKTIAISIDSSKSNTAIWIMSRSYVGLDLLEFDGSSDKDVLSLIKEQRAVMRSVFNGAIIEDGGIEDIITKKEEEAGGKYSEGLKYHHSRYVITAVFISLIVFFQDMFDYTLETIPNQTWKSVVLPEYLNKRGVYKGSVEYIRSKYPQYITGVKDDDGTDAICIGEYMKVRKGFDKDKVVDDIPDDMEFTIHEFKYYLSSKHTNITSVSINKFQYNSHLDLEKNARSIANRISKDNLGVALVPIQSVTVSDIYKRSIGVFPEDNDYILLVVKRV